MKSRLSFCVSETSPIYVRSLLRVYKWRVQGDSVFAEPLKSAYYGRICFHAPTAGGKPNGMNPPTSRAPRMTMQELADQAAKIRGWYGKGFVWWTALTIGASLSVPSIHDLSPRLGDIIGDTWFVPFLVGWIVLILASQRTPICPQCHRLLDVMLALVTGRCRRCRNVVMVDVPLIK